MITNFIDQLKAALEKAYEIKEEYVATGRWEDAVKIRDFGDSIKRMVTQLTYSDKVDLINKRRPYKNCKHLALNSTPNSIQEKVVGTYDYRRELDEEAKNLGYKDHEDLELCVIEEVEKCGQDCIWWKWHNDILAHRMKAGKSISERQPDWNPEEYSEGTSK